LKKRIAIFASGSDAYVLQRADNFEVPSHIFDKKEFYQTDKIVQLLKNLNINLVVLAGFLWLVPDNLLKAYPNKIINIHPSLLPKFGGKGMYGDKVHAAVLEEKEQESGISIHFVNEHFDEGEVIHQSKFRVEKGDDLKMLKFKVQQLEHQHFPKVIESLLKKMKSI
jgi:phosphoribosylglycinamide formyltransferase-1